LVPGLVRGSGLVQQDRQAGEVLDPDSRRRGPIEVFHRRLGVHQRLGHLADVEGEPRQQPVATGTDVPVRVPGRPPVHPVRGVTAFPGLAAPQGDLGVNQLRAHQQLVVAERRNQLAELGGLLAGQLQRLPGGRQFQLCDLVAEGARVASVRRHASSFARVRRARVRG
jgi:hypothetical protein